MCIMVNVKVVNALIFSGALSRAAERHGKKIWLPIYPRNFGSYVTVCARLIARPSVRTTGTLMLNNSINRYGNPNATQGRKSHGDRGFYRQKTTTTKSSLFRRYFLCLHSRG